MAHSHANTSWTEVSCSRCTMRSCSMVRPISMPWSSLAIESHTAWYAPATSPATTADSSLKWSLSDMPKANVPTTRSPVREERTGTLRK